MTRRTWPSSETDLDFGPLGKVVFDGNLEMRKMRGKAIPYRPYLLFLPQVLKTPA